MKRLFILLLLFSISLASNSAGQFEDATGGSPLELVSDWRVIAILSIVFSAILVAIAYAAGIGFEMPEIKAWAGIELTQIFVNAIIIVSLLAVISFLDALVVGMVYSSGLEINECTGFGQQEYETCLQAVAIEYLEDYETTLKSSMRNILIENVKAVNLMNTRVGAYCTGVICGQIGISHTIAAENTLDVDRNTILFEYYTNLLSFLRSQLFFVNNVSFKMGPVILAVGIVARSFFMTRKLGGLLIAISFGIIFFLPGMYLFDWATMDMFVNGDKALDAAASSCPSECTKKAPLAYYYDGGDLMLIEDPTELRQMFLPEDVGKASGIYDGSIASAPGTNGSAQDRTIFSCRSDANTTFCPEVCRALPYPSIPNCADFITQISCSLVPKECKVIKLVEEPVQNSKCPDSCKIIPPLRSDCNTGPCLLSSIDCRLTVRSNTNWRPSVSDEVDSDKKAFCDLAQYCEANYNANLSCVYVMPVTGPCDGEGSVCQGCPAQCRVTGGNPANMPPECQLYALSCSLCHETCKVDISDISSLNAQPPSCMGCPLERRLMGPDLPEEYSLDLAAEGGYQCSFSSCPAQYRAFLPRSSCEECLFTEESETYSPAINNQCDESCKPTISAHIKDPDSYSTVGGDGLVGKPDIQSLSKMMLPIYVLPLFNFVATIVFIKGLSKMLGGDIEIPGISKVF